MSPELAGSEAVRPGRGGHGAGLRAAAAAGAGDWGYAAWRRERVCRGTLEAGGSQEGQREAGSRQARWWWSAATMSAQCCAGQVSRERQVGRPGQEPRQRGLLWVHVPAPPPQVGWVTLRRLGECSGPERGARPSGKTELRLGRGGQGSGEGSRLFQEGVASSPEHECVVLSSVGHLALPTR
ncbi:hypothetical protein J1605_010613 [Eschrichtius robustus]|uniref:Uncharacterized protein n=1 Tax=Eschrichtius robustus TaxID=9764 RepID=A0AB34GT87_ESCRO|nr:hypothetical protein J1605_010613 [Eschrichtius robustus]